MSLEQLSITVRSILDSNVYSIPCNVETTILQLKEKISKVISIPAQEQVLFLAGNILEDKKTIKSYNIFQYTVLMLAVQQRANNNNNNNTVDFIHENWTRKPLSSLMKYPTPEDNGKSLLPLPNLSNGLEKADIYLWCCNGEHKRLGDEYFHSLYKTHRSEVFNTRYGENSPYPQQLQKGSLRPRCGVCKNESVQVDSSLLTSWIDLFQIQEHKKQIFGECCNCGIASINARERLHGDFPPPVRVPVEFYIKCAGELATGRMCKSELTDLKSVALPCVVTNFREEESYDDFSIDPIQIEFQPCKHKISFQGLNYFLQTDLRSKLATIELFPDLLGKYIVQCGNQCSGVIFRPVLKLASEELYHIVNQWQTKEKILLDGGVMCPLCNVPFFTNLPGPKLSCPNCKHEFCENHRVAWGDCSEIMLCFEKGSFQECYHCHERGIKDENCTHITCNCGKYWCYVCEKPLDKNHNTRNPKCPQYLESYFFSRENESSIYHLFIFHRFKTIRLLRECRNKYLSHEREAEFDATFNNLPLHKRKVIHPLLAHFNSPVTLKEVLQYPNSNFSRGNYRHP